MLKSAKRASLVENLRSLRGLLLARLENRPARLDLTFYPYLPAATVGTTDPRAYLGLIAGQDCQSASDRDPRSASNKDPLVLRFGRLALAPSELLGVAETGRARVGV
jgi:hypothetical protein